MKTVLITGAAGFLGCHLTKKYLDEGCKVIGIDDFTTSNQQSRLFKQNLDNKDFVFCQDDVRNDATSSCWNVIKTSYDKIDLVLNFACPASPPQYQKIPIKTLTTSVIGIKNALECAKYYNCQLIQASTSEVYGDPTITPQTESYNGNVNCYGIRSNYDEGKRCAEALIHSYIQEHNLDARIVRIFNTYGPGMLPNDGRVISNFICQALQYNPITIYGNGNQSRSFCYVDDLIEQIYRVSLLKKGTLNSPINIGNDTTFTIQQLVQVIVREVQIVPKIRYENYPQDDPLTRKPDLTLARKLLNYSAQITLQEGIKNTIPWFRECLNGEKND